MYNSILNHFSIVNSYIVPIHEQDQRSDENHFLNIYFHFHLFFDPAPDNETPVSERKMYSPCTKTVHIPSWRI